MTSADPYHRRAVTQAAVAILTDDFADPDASRPLQQTELGRLVHDGDLTDADLLLGMRNVAAHLLVKLEKLGQEPGAVLQDIGLKAASLRNREP